MTETEIKEFENLCYLGLADCRLLQPAEYKYFTELTKLYDLFKNKAITEEDAKKRKQQIYNEYKNDVNIQENYRAVYKQHQDNIRSVSMYLAAVNKEQDKDKLLNMMAEMIGILIADSTFATCQKKKFERGNSGESDTKTKQG